MLKFILIGRIGSGRSFFQNLLETNGFKVAKSYTTRESVGDNDRFHHFIDKNDVSGIENRVLETEHNSNSYFYTREELENADIIPVDPENVENLCNMFPDTPFHIISIMASNADRLSHAVIDAEDKLIAEEEFLAACEEENAAFCNIEDKMVQKRLNIDNLTMGHMVDNDFTDTADIFGFIDTIKAQITMTERLTMIINELAEAGSIEMNPDTGKIKVWIHKNDSDETTVIEMSVDMFAETTILDHEGTWHMMSTWLSLKDNKHF